MKKICIIGCGGHARSVADVAIDKWPDINISFYDENAKENERIFGSLVLPLAYLKDNDACCIVAIGNIRMRENISCWLEYSHYSTCSIISKRSYVSGFSEIGIGSFLANACHIGPESHIGKGCVINTGAIVEHGVSVGDFSSINVNAAICGKCIIGKRVYVGAGAVVRDGITICDDTVIGAGAVVVKDIAKPGIYTGCPATSME